MAVCFSASQRSHSLGVIVVSGLVVAGAVVILARTKQQASLLPVFEQNSPARTTSGDRRVVLEGFATANYSEDGKVVSRLRLGKCELRPTSAANWLFDSGPVLEMHDVQVDLFHCRPTDPASSHPAAPETAEAIDSLTRLPRQFRWGALGGLDVRNVSFNLYEDDHRETAIHAQRLTPGAGGELTLKQAVSVSTRDDRRQLTSAEVIWWPHFGVLAVKGDYQLTEAGHPHPGARTIFNLALEPITNQQEISRYEEHIRHPTELTAAQ